MLDITCKEARALCAFIDLYKSKLTKECYERDLSVIHNKILNYTVLCDREEKELLKCARTKPKIVYHCKYCFAELQRGVHWFCGNNCLELFEAMKNMKIKKKRNTDDF